MKKLKTQNTVHRGLFGFFAAWARNAIHAKTLAERYGVKTALTFSDSSMPISFNEGLLEVLGSGVDLLFVTRVRPDFTAQDVLKTPFVT